MTNRTVTLDTKVLEQLVWALESCITVTTGPGESEQLYNVMAVQSAITTGRAALANAEQAEPEPKLWLWKNFVDGKQEYWVFDNLYPININDDDPQTLGDPCGYALFKPSRNGRKDTL